jgi:hypothetical protein
MSASAGLESGHERMESEENDKPVTFVLGCGREPELNTFCRHSLCPNRYRRAKKTLNESRPKRIFTGTASPSPNPQEDNKDRGL